MSLNGVTNHYFGKKYEENFSNSVVGFGKF